MTNKKQIALSALTALTLVAFSACGDENHNNSTNDETVSIGIPTVNFSGVLQDKYGEPIVSHDVCIGNSCVQTDTNGVFTINSIPVQSGVQVGGANLANSGNSGTTVTMVTPDVLNKDGNVTTHLGLTATILVNKYLSAVYTNGNQSYFTRLDGKTVYAGVIQLPQLGAYLSGRLENKATGESINATKAYFTMADDFANVASSGAELSNTTQNKYTIISNKEKIFTVNVDSSTGEFTASNLPYRTSFDVKVSGYKWSQNGRDAKGDRIATLDNSISYSIGDVELNKEADMGDDIGVQFVAINNAVGTGDYNDLGAFNFTGSKYGVVTKATNMPSTFIAPTKTITLEFSEKLNSATIDKDSVKYVKTMSPEAFTTYSEIAQLEDNKNSNTKTLTTKYEALLLSEAALRDYVGVQTDLNVTDKTFVGLYNNYLTQVKTVVATATQGDNAAGIDTIPSYTVYSADANTSIDRTAANLDANVPVSLTQKGVITQYSTKTFAQTKTGLELDAKTAYFNSLTDIYTTYSVKDVKATDDKVTITLDKELAKNNVVIIGLKTFDFTDAAGNILKNTYKNGTLNVEGYITEINVGTAE